MFTNEIFIKKKLFGRLKQFKCTKKLIGILIINLWNFVTEKNYFLIIKMEGNMSKSVLFGLFENLTEEEKQMFLSQIFPERQQEVSYCSFGNGKWIISFFCS